MGNPKGSWYERQLMAYLREEGHDVERLRLAGKEDEGDILLRLNAGRMRLVIEAKNRAQMNLGGWIAEAEEEAANYAAHRALDLEDVHWAVVHKRKGKGTAKSYVTLPLDEFLRLL